MSSEFSVDLDHLDEIVTKLSALAAFIDERLDGIDGRIATLSGTGWESIAAQAYTEAHRQWSVSAREFVEGVKDLSDAAKKAHADLTYAVELNSNMLNGG
ncbi:WXG100 family type VII secretion target [Nocardia farcinica]|uniref:ESAT-6-like protein n=2 Tax=Nocardia farcinica TaxID=37329 RepID=Q5Z2J1_NOCFA|nr:WXG100 family type VII secretion target [Nocardia farcinica]MBF6070295.1 WXG100 family type VII secretion target [Nocardia farcinica]MBF6233715.1 WXG100 family type VII secretion target [Nocardia farcinica]MBF6251879.1 WXG100 family type VII secretion target [Nocardia farcinica]MBF6257966.1 WXG100 family type VII secretion target [Nocardia farcinica]MBF6293064.1 WXG100 family type VII secretion target [Nocardia farcinica]